MFALFSDPGGTSLPGHYGRLTRPPSFRQQRLAARNGFRGSIARLPSSLSTLRPAGCPDRTQDSFPAAGHALPGGISYPQGSNERFQSCFLHLIPLSQALPGATKMPSWKRSSPVPSLFRWWGVRADPAALYPSGSIATRGAFRNINRPARRMGPRAPCFTHPPTAILVHGDWPKAIRNPGGGTRMAILRGVWCVLRLLLPPRAQRVLENLALRQQRAVLRRSLSRPRLRPWDRLF
jgi:hypothetical protein